MISRREALSQIRGRVWSGLTALGGLVALGTISFRTLEGWSWAEALYFSTATITTVGYGDLHPTTDLSRLVAVVYMLVSVAVAFTALTSIGSAYLSRRNR